MSEAVRVNRFESSINDQIDNWQSEPELLSTSLQVKWITVFAAIDQSREAAKAGVTLRATLLISSAIRKQVPR